MTIGAEESRVVRAIVPVQQSTMGYVAELALFLNKNEREIRGLQDLSADVNTSATITNKALREMILECYTLLALNTAPYEYAPRYVKAREADGAVYTFSVEGAAYLALFDYTQPLAYTVILDMEEGKVQTIEPVTQSTKGYVAELSLFIGKTHAQVLNLSDLSTDSNTSATATNTVLREMVLECFYEAEYAEAGNG